MKKSVFTDKYEVFITCLIAERKAAGLTQQQLADRLNKPQSFVSKYERGERRLDVVEFLAVVQATGADACKLIKKIQRESRLAAGMAER